MIMRSRPVDLDQKLEKPTIKPVRFVIETRVIESISFFFFKKKKVDWRENVLPCLTSLILCNEEDEQYYVQLPPSLSTMAIVALPFCVIAFSLSLFGSNTFQGRRWLQSEAMPPFFFFFAVTLVPLLLHIWETHKRTWRSILLNEK